MLGMTHPPKQQLMVKLKFSLLLMVILGVYNPVGSQSNYIEYYNLVNQANRSWHEKDYAKSLQNFQEAFEKVEYVHSINFAKAARTAAKIEDFKLTKRYILEAIKKGYPNNFIDSKIFKKFRKSDEYKALKTQMGKAQVERESSVNKEYKSEIDSLHFIDQHILRGRNNVTGFIEDPNLQYSDSANFSYLLKLIDLYGFPSERNIGFEGYSKSWVIIHHSARLPNNHYYHPSLLAYLKAGEYSPENYCWVIDQGNEIEDEPLTYYHWDVATDIDELSIQEKEAINQKRKAVGMPLIDRIEVVEKSNVKTNRVKW